MSALIQSPSLFRSLRCISEAEAILSIGRIAARATDAATGLESLANTALRLKGIHGVQVCLEATGTPDVLEWHDSKAPAQRGAATGLIVRSGREWGKFRILFEPRLKSVECPLQFARLLAQQTATMLERLELVAKKFATNSALLRLQERLETRKAFSRAAGILAQTKQLSHETALSILLKQALEQRRSPLVLARRVILGAETGLWAPLTLRQLQPGDATTKAPGR